MKAYCHHCRRIIDVTDPTGFICRMCNGETRRQREGEYTVMEASEQTGITPFMIRKMVKDGVVTPIIPTNRYHLFTDKMLVLLMEAVPEYAKKRHDRL